MSISAENKMGITMDARKSTYSDYLVGQRIRLARTIVEQSQHDLAAELGISNAQLQKYEAGRDRISAGRLHAIANLTNMPISFFFQSIDDEYQIFEQKEFHIDLLQNTGVKRIMRYAFQIKCKKKINLLVEIADNFRKL